jgi:hypothetical protein
VGTARAAVGVARCSVVVQNRCPVKLVANYVTSRSDAAVFPVVHREGHGSVAGVLGGLVRLQGWRRWQEGLWQISGMQR